jgi:hypothetical protein
MPPGLGRRTSCKGVVGSIMKATEGKALEERGGLEAVLRQVPERSDSFSVAIEAAVPWWPAARETIASYEIEIGHAQEGARGAAGASRVMRAARTRRNCDFVV